MASDTWSRTTLSALVTGLQAGVSVNADDRVRGSGELGVLKTSAVYGGAFDARQHKAVWRRDVRRVAAAVVGNTVIISRMNTPELVGESAYVADSHPGIFLPDRLWTAAPRAGVSARWLGFVLQSPSAKRYISLNATGTSGSMKNLPKSRLLRMPLDAPPATEQDRIAEVLDTVDEAIRTTEQVIAKLEQVKHGLLHDLLTRGIDENGEIRDPERHPEKFKDSPLGRIPKAWEFGALSTWLREKPKNGYSPTPWHEATGVLMLGLGCLTPSGFSPHQLKFAPPRDPGLESARLADGDLLVSRSNTRELVGLSGIYRDVGAVCTYPDLMMRVRTDRRLSTSYLDEWLRSPAGRRQMQAAAVGTSGSMVKVTGSIVSRLVTVVPSAEEQVSIVAKLDSSREHLKSETHSLEKLRLLKKGLMDDLLTGRVRVPGANGAA